MRFSSVTASPILVAIAQLLVSPAASLDGDGKCRALILSGGANNGFWEAGVLWGLLHYGDPADYTWDVASGVSAGSINTSLIATWPKGSEYEATEWMSEKYQELQSNDQAWILRSNNLYDLMFKEVSIADDQPAYDTIDGWLNERGSIERRFVVSATDINTGEYVPQTQHDTPFEELTLAAVSSGSLPGIFQPRRRGNHLFMDGGTVWNSNLDTALQQCRELVDRNEDIIVDALITMKYVQPEETVEKNAYANYKNAKAIHDYYVNYNALQEQAKAYPGIEFRYIFMETRHECAVPEYDFKNSTCWCLQEQGRADAKAMLEVGQENIGMSLEEWTANKELRKEYRNFRDYLNYLYNLI